MDSGSLKSGAFLGVGAGLGLWVGALLWRANEERPGSAGISREVEGEFAAADNGRMQPGRPAVAGGGGAKESVGDRSSRLEALAALFRRTHSTRNAESLQHYSEVLGGVSRLSGDDFPQLFRLMEFEDKFDQETTILPLLRWAGEDPKAALAFALSRGEFKGSERVISALMYQLAKVDVAEAKASLAMFPEKSEESRDARRAIVRVLLLRDPGGALAYARELKDDKAEAMVLTEWAKAEPLAAAEELDSTNPALRPVVEAIANTLLAQDRASFDSWAGGLTDPVARNTVRRIALTRYTLADPAKAAQDTAAWLSSEPTAAASAGELPTQIAQRWWSAEASPKVVADWASSLPAGPALNAAVGEVGRLWVEQDAIAASGWINGLATGPGRDAAVRQLFWAIQQETPDDAFVWATTIQDSAVRRDLLRDFIRGWASKDKGAALSAVETLPIEHRGELREIISKAQSIGR